MGNFSTGDYSRLTFNRGQVAATPRFAILPIPHPASILFSGLLSGENRYAR